LRSLARVSGAAIVTACCIAPVLLTLYARVPDLIDRPFTARQYGWAEAPVEIPGSVLSSFNRPYTLHRLFLRTTEPAGLAHDEIRFLTATYGTRPALESAELRIQGTDCAYTSTSGASIPDYGLFALRAASGCRPLQGAPTGKVSLVIKLTKTARVGVWTYPVPPAVRSRDSLAIDANKEFGGAGYLAIGRTVDVVAPTGHRRADLLAYVWQIGNHPGWIACVVLSCAVLMFVGAATFWVSEKTDRDQRGRAAMPALGAACLAASLGILYAVLTPPFEAPDEPNHLTAFVQLEGREDLAGEATRWGRVGHFNRIYYSPQERFRPADVGNLDDEWVSAYAPDVTQRGSGASVWWRLVSRVTRPLVIERQFLLLRLFDAVLLAATLGGCAWLIARLRPAESAHLRLAGVFFIPALPFWAMQVSNYAPMISCYLVMATGMLLLVLDDEHDATAAFLMSAGWGAATLIARSAAPLAGLLAALAIGRCLLGGRARGLTNSLRFWIAFALPIAVALALSDRAYLETQAALMQRLLPRGAGALTAWLTTHPFGLLIPAVLAAALETGVAILKRRLAPDAHMQDTCAGALAWAAAVALAFVAISSLWLRYPLLPLLDPLHMPHHLAYAVDTVKAVLTMGRLANHDFLTSITFWGGLGWRGIVLADWVLGALAGGIAVMAALLCASLAMTRATRRITWLAWFVGGVIAASALYAVSTMAVTASAGVSVNIVGRYLLGLYLAPVMIAWTPLAESAHGGRGSAARFLPLAAALASAALHGYCLSISLQRYF